MRTRRQYSVLLLVPALLLVPLSASTLVACGQTVAAIDPRDPSLPVQTRKWLAAAQDGVMAARARRDSARSELAVIRAWADRSIDSVELADGANDALEALADARVHLAEVELEIAETGVAYAEAKLELTYAERSVHHDLGSYELQPLQDAVDAIRESVSDLTRERVSARQEVLDAGRQWWSAYATYADGGGDTRSYWIGDREPITDVIEAEERDGSAGESESDEDTDADQEDDEE